MTEQPPPVDKPAPIAIARPVSRAPVVSPWRDMELPRVCRRDALLDLTVILLASVVLPYLPGLLAPPAPGLTELPEVGLAAIVQKWAEAALAVGLLIYFVLRHRIRPAAFGLRGDQMGRQLLWALATLVGVYVVLILTSLAVTTLHLIFPELRDDLAKRVEFAEALPVDDLAVTLILLLAVAIHEESLFRGLLLPFLRRTLGSWWSAGLVSALIFAALHVPHQGILAGGVQVLGIAVVLTIFFLLSRSLLAVTLAHFLFDLVQFQLLRLLPKLEQWLENLDAW